jgi:hypothetical protein
MDLPTGRAEPTLSAEDLKKLDEHVQQQIQETAEVIPDDDEKEHLRCKACGFVAKTRAGLGSHKRKHKR